MNTSLDPGIGGSSGGTVDVGGGQLPRDFGDPAAEYKAVRGGAGVARRADLAMIRFTGRDPVRIVQGLVTNDLKSAAPGEGVYAAMLTPKGRVVTDLRAFVRDTPGGPEVWLLLPRQALDATRQHLSKYVPPMFARWSDVSDEQAVIGVYGPASQIVLERALGASVADLPEDAFVDVGWGDGSCIAAATRYAGGEKGFDVLIPADHLEEVWERLLASGAQNDSDAEVRPIGWEALEMLRIEAGRPRCGAELSEEVIATEAYEATGLLPRAISSTKGCYTGQEVIVRIAHRGHVNRHLRGLLFEGDSAPAPDTALVDPDRERSVGRVTSAAFSPLLNRYVGLGYVRREFEPGDTVRLASTDGAPAEVTTLPFFTA